MSYGHAKKISQGPGVYRHPGCDQAVGLLKHRYSWENTRTVGATPLHVPEAGLHTLSLWMREDGCIVDKIVITSSSEFRLWSGL